MDMRKPRACRTEHKTPTRTHCPCLREPSNRTIFHHNTSPRYVTWSQSNLRRFIQWNRLLKGNLGSAGVGQQSPRRTSLVYDRHIQSAWGASMHMRRLTRRSSCPAIRSLVVRQSARLAMTCLSKCGAALCNCKPCFE